MARIAPRRGKRVGRPLWSNVDARLRPPWPAATPSSSPPPLYPAQPHADCICRVPPSGRRNPQHRQTSPMTIAPVIATGHAKPRRTARAQPRHALPDVRVIAAGEYIYREAEPRLCVYRVDRGAIAVFQRRLAQRGSNIQIAGPNDYLGLGCLRHHRDNARALVESVIRPIPGDECARLARHDAELRRKQDEAIERDFEYGKELARNRGKANPVECVATFLIALSTQNGYEGRDQQVITDSLDGTVVTGLLGIDENTLGCTLAELQAMNLVERYPPASLRIKNIEALRRVANGAGAAERNHAAASPDGKPRTSLVDRALASPAGAHCLRRAESRLEHHLQSGRFNTEGAVHLFTCSTDDAVWSYLRDHPLARIIYRNYRATLAGHHRGLQLARAFIQRTKATDQRPARFWLKFALGP
jgi:CRP-like cAMP-binding protein